MKNVLLSVIALGLATVNAYAVDANSSWAEIFAAPGVRVDAPQVAFGAPTTPPGLVTTAYVSIFDVNVGADGKIYTNDALPIYKHIGPKSQKIQIGTAILSTDADWSHAVEAAGTQIIVKGNYIGTYDVQVLDVSKSEQYPTVLFTKAYELK